MKILPPDAFQEISSFQITMKQLGDFHLEALEGAIVNICIKLMKGYFKFFLSYKSIASDHRKYPLGYLLSSSNHFVKIVMDG